MKIKITESVYEMLTLICVKNNGITICSKLFFFGQLSTTVGVEWQSFELHKTDVP